MRFLSDEWLAALDRAARGRPVTDPDPLADVELTVEQVVEGARTWRLVVSRGRLSVEAGPASGEPDVRLTSDHATAASIASGQRAALDAFVHGDLVIGGDIRSLLEHREAMEALGDLFADVRSATDFGATT